MADSYMARVEEALIWEGQSLHSLQSMRHLSGFSRRNYRSLSSCYLSTNPTSRWACLKERAQSHRRGLFSCSDELDLRLRRHWVGRTSRIPQSSRARAIWTHIYPASLKELRLTDLAGVKAAWKATLPITGLWQRSSSISDLCPWGSWKACMEVGKISSLQKLKERDLTLPNQ